MNTPNAAQPVTARSHFLVWLGVIIVLALGIRLAVISAIPLFNDEAVYMLRALAFPSLLAKTLADGKLVQELLLAGWIRLPGDALVLARSISVLAGAATICAIGLLGRSLGRPRVGLIAACCYALAPISVMHDVLALPDSMVAFVSVVVVAVSAQFGLKPQINRRDAAIVGLTIGLAAATKLTGALLFCLPLAAIVLLSKPTERHVRFRLLPTVMLALLAVLAILALGHYGGAELHKTNFRTIADRITALGQATVLAGNTVVWYLPAPLLLVCIPALLPGATSHAYQVARWLVVSSAGYTLALLILGTTIYPRYLLPIFPSLALAAALCIDQLWRMEIRWQRWLARVALGAALLWNGFFIMHFQTTPLDAPMLTIDRSQYFGTWTAGYHLDALNAWIRQQAARPGGVIVANHDQPRLVHMSTEIALRDRSDIRFVQVDLTSNAAPAQLDELARTGRVLLPLDDQERVAFEFDLRFPRARLEQTYLNPLGTMRFYLYSYGEVK